MSDQQESWPGSFLPGKQVPRAIHFLGHVNPARGQAEGLQFPSHDVADSTHALVVHGATADIDGVLKELNGVGLVLVNPRHNALFLFAKALTKNTNRHAQAEHDQARRQGREFIHSCALRC